MTPEEVTYIAPTAEPWDPPVIECIKKSTSRWEIKVSGKTLYLGTGPSKILAITSPYKPGDPARVTLSCSDEISRRVHLINGMALDFVKISLAGTIMNGVMMTPETIESMLLSDASVECGLNTTDCAFFDMDGQEIDVYELQENTEYLFAIEPTALWCFKKRIGVKWYIRQIRQMTVPRVEEDWSL